jgi:hypothetical protein
VISSRSEGYARNKGLIVQHFQKSGRQFAGSQKKNKAIFLNT